MCDANTVLAIVPLLSFVPLLLSFIFYNQGRSLKKADRERLYFRMVYNLSIERMLEESPIDRNKVVAFKSRKNGRIWAIRYVRKWEPVPLEVAAQFVDAIW
ncbi:hypothetical protein HMPREF0742_01249 [Rothia aeria F0184]|uniref:Uncharacterized protein n=1 Tax=Rothia aeria F0184 TaxID=888019 RepID=U7V3E0_9MICC|nr:hypothetical protein HMPREF0742_01249 [Rothia aeria F0184]